MISGFLRCLDLPEIRKQRVCVCENQTTLADALSLIARIMTFRKLK